MRRILLALLLLGLVTVLAAVGPPSPASKAQDGVDPATTDSAPKASEKDQAEKPTATKDANEPERIPPGLKRYKGREIAQTMHFSGAPWLMRAERQQEEDCELLLKTLNFQPGQVVCDMGCGNGFYTLPIAKQVGAEGKVYGVDIQPEMLTLLEQRFKQEGLTNIEPILGTLIDPKLPEHSVDAILLVDVYHEFSHPVHMLRAMRKSLKPEGRLILVEFRKEDPKVLIKPEHKMTKKQIMKEIPINGFELVEEFDELPWQHLMYFAPTQDDDAEDKPKKSEPKAGKSAAKREASDDELDDTDPENKDRDDDRTSTDAPSDKE